MRATKGKKTDLAARLHPSKWPGRQRKAMSPAFAVAPLRTALLAMTLLATTMGAALSTERADSEFLSRFAVTWPETDFSKHSVPASEFLSGGPQRDGIPSIDVPAFEKLHEGEAGGWTAHLDPAAPLIVVSMNGDVRAYPLEIMLWHEIVNDEVGGIPVAITYCPLCNSALAFRREIDGKRLDFGTTGLLRNSNLVMYDRQTESWWQQFTGRALVGDLATSKLSLVPSRLESFGTFSRKHPEGLVMVPRDRSFRPYGKTPYRSYDTAPAAPFLKGYVETGPLRQMSEVLVLRGDAKPVAISIDYLRSAQTLETENFRVVWRPGMNSALDQSDIAKGRDVGEIEIRSVGREATSEIPVLRTFAFVYRSFFPDGTVIAKCRHEKDYQNVECR